MLKGNVMRLAAKIVGILVSLIGLVWTLQGINILKGSSMSAQPFWAIMGIVLLVVGLTITYFGWRRGNPAA